MSMGNLYPPTDRPRVVHRLAVVLRFVDAFASTSVRVPLRVWIPAQNWPGRPANDWEARRSVKDDTYRFLVTNAAIPAGDFNIQVEAPGGEYVSLEAISVSLPMIPPGPPPPPPPPPRSALEYLVERTLWPTVRLRPPTGETAVIGRVTSTGGSSVEGLRVVLYHAGDPVPASPYTRTDASGQFLFRLPRQKSQIVMGVVVSTVNLAIEIRDVSNTVLAVSPAGPYTVNLGQVTVLPFVVP